MRRRGVLTYNSTLQVISRSAKEDFLLLDLFFGRHLLLTAFASETTTRGVSRSESEVRVGERTGCNGRIAAAEDELWR